MSRPFRLHSSDYVGIRRYFLICWGGKTIKGLTVAYAGYFGLRWLLRLLGMP